MEFGALIPLYYMGLCCFIATLLIGLGALLSIRFSKKDLTLSRNIIFTILIVCFLWFLVPLIQLIYAAISICRTCPDSTFKITGEIILASLSVGAGMALIPGTTMGFLIAFIIVTPITLAIRRFREKKDVNLSPGE